MTVPGSGSAIWRAQIERTHSHWSEARKRSLNVHQLGSSVTQSTGCEASLRRRFHSPPLKPAVAGLPPQRRTPLRVHGQRGRRQRSPQLLVVLGSAITTPRVYPTRQKDQQTPLSNRRQPRPWSLPRTHRINQHQNPVTHPDRLRVPRTPTPHRPRSTRPRKPPTTTPRPKMTHGYSRRAT